MNTATLTLAQIYPSQGTQGTVKTGNQIQVQATALGADGNPSGAQVELVSSNTNVASVTTPIQIGNSPAGVVGVGAGTATITATALDATTVTATLAVTVQ